jgi:hypothetical protein
MLIFSYCIENRDLPFLLLVLSVCHLSRASDFVPLGVSDKIGCSIWI